MGFHHFFEFGIYEERTAMVYENSYHSCSIALIEACKSLALKDDLESFKVIYIGKAIPLHCQSDSNKLQGRRESERGDSSRGTAEVEDQLLMKGAIFLVESSAKIVKD
jgi:hypothetical protein